MDIQDTKSRILDAAEKLFARRGFHGTSLREITREAGVNLAAVNYHFGSKSSLIEAIFERRLRPVNEERFARLAGVEEQAGREGRQPLPAEVLRAFIEPTLRFRHSTPGAEYFVTLVGRFFIDEDETFRAIFLRHVGPLLHKVHLMLCQALPAIDKEVLLWRLHFVIGAMSHVMLLSGRIKSVGKGLNPCDDSSCIDTFLSFVTAGVEAAPR